MNLIFPTKSVILFVSDNEICFSILFERSPEIILERFYSNLIYELLYTKADLCFDLH